MFCSACGAKLVDGVRFCFNCGAKIGEASDVFLGASPGKKLVPAKCTNCASPLEVDSEQQAAICPYCGSAYIIDEAINNYNLTLSGNLTVNGAVINVNGVSTDNLLERAREYAYEGEFDEALDYFNQVLDADVTSTKAKDGIKTIKTILNDYVYKSEKTPQGLLELKKERLILTNNVNPQMFELSRIFGVEIQRRGLFSSRSDVSFIYNGIPQRRITVDVEDVNGWYVAIEDAKMGKYPKMTGLGKLFKNAANNPSNEQ